MKKGLLITLAVIVLGGIVFASMRQGQSGHKGAKVDLETVARRSITQVVKASGRVDPRIKVNLSAHVIGKIEHLYVEEGDEVTAGQPVLELEKEAFLAIRDRIAAQLQIARSQLRQAEIDLRDAQLRQKRYQRLQDDGVVSREKLDAVDLEVASGELRIDQAGEEIHRVQADLEKARDDLEKVTIYAPITGRVIELNAEEGEVVVSGTMNNPASVIGVIADLSEILVEIDVDETEIVDVALGQRGVVDVDAISDFEYIGEVVEVGSSGYSQPSQPDVTFFRVKLLLENADERLRPGMSARAEIEVATHQDTWTVPIQAVVFRPPHDDEQAAPDEDAEADAAIARDAADRDEEIEVVFVYADGKAVQRPVETGLADALEVEILSGLEEGERIIVGPYRELKKLEHDAAVQERDAKSKKSDGKDDEDGDSEDGDEEDDDGEGG